MNLTSNDLISHYLVTFAISSGIGGGQPIYITTTTPTLSQPQLPQQQITLAPISSTQQFGNNGTTGATVASPGMFPLMF